MTGRVHSIESFGLVDGPGVRSVVFLQGCAMRCRYCHNPETWSMQGGEKWTAPYWKEKGGITVSGGEAMLQMEFVTQLFAIAKAHHIHTALDTSGNPFCLEEHFLEQFQKLMDVTDLFIVDIKEMDSDRHRKLTGQNNLSEHKKSMWIRHVLVPHLTDSEDSLIALRKFLEPLQGIEKIEILPYHAMGVHKWEALGIPYSLKDVNPPTAEEVEKAKKILNIG